MARQPLRCLFLSFCLELAWTIPFKCQESGSDSCFSALEEATLPDFEVDSQSLSLIAINSARRVAAVAASAAASAQQQAAAAAPPAHTPVAPTPADREDGAFVGSAAAAAALLSGSRSSASSTPPVAKTDVEARVTTLLATMSRTDKYKFVRGNPYLKAVAPPEGHYVGEVNLEGVAGVPPLNMQDNGNGFRTLDWDSAGHATSWPCALAVAATFSTELVEAWGKALGKEFRAKGANVLLGPGLNVHRVPHGGRNVEYLPGESPYLGAKLAGPYVKGVQSQHVLAVMKHFIANSQETHRDTGSSNMDRRTLWEVYYPPFQAAIDAGVACAMCGYNKVNGIYSCENKQMLVDDLRDKMKFDGWVMSDWFAAHSFSADQGLDQEMPTTADTNYFSPANMDTLSDEKVDSMVRPILTKMATYGLLDDPVCVPPNCSSREQIEVVTNDKNTTAFSRELATASVLLLQNKGKVLPLREASGKTVALLGSACGAPAKVDSFATGDLYSMGGSGRVYDPNTVTIETGIRSACQAVGCTVVSEASDIVDAAIAVSELADIAIACGGSTTTEVFDRMTLSLPQEKFLVSLASQIRKPLITVTMTPGSITTPWRENTAAMLNIFLGGSETGHAVANIIFGFAFPAAKSPVTFPVSEYDMTPPCMSLNCSYDEGLNVGFHGMNDKDVAFPFGHGLSFTDFDYKLIDLAEANSAIQNGECSQAHLCLTASITNAGDLPGIEVAQLYLGYPEEAQEPPKVLRGFVRSSTLKAGESADISFGLLERDLQVFDPSSETWKLPNGSFKAWVGSSSRDLRLTAEFSICGGTLHLGPPPAGICQ
mmetsp:Transcript_91478/g.191207  ORF Transcript_91478/g.191207 Transcript_91478/m.191207 type:complete len:826 (+) Transcript_91478:129-2606(+)